MILKNTSLLCLVIFCTVWMGCGEKPATKETEPGPQAELKPQPVNVLPQLDTTYETDGTSLKQVKQQYENDTTFRLWNYSSGKLNGESYSYHPDGKPFSMHTYVDGKKTGPYKTWHDNGNLYMEGQWKEDVPVGIWKFYNEAGQLVKEIDSDKEPIQMQPDTLRK
jgi:hypothetical protein